MKRNDLRSLPRKIRIGYQNNFSEKSIIKRLLEDGYTENQISEHMPFSSYKTTFDESKKIASERNEK